MSDKEMTPSKLSLENLKESMKVRSLQNAYSKREKKDILIYSQSKGLFYTLLFSLMLWWIPIAGPAIAGYIGGRKSGDTSKALTASLVTTSVLVMITLLLAPFQSGFLGGASTYFGKGVLTLSQSSLIAYSGLLTDLYTGYGLVKTFTLIVPGSLIILNAFSYTGGFVSKFRAQEDNLSLSFVRKDVEDRSRNLRTVPRIPGYGKVIKTISDGSEDDDDGVGGWSYL